MPTTQLLTLLWLLQSLLPPQELLLLQALSQTLMLLRLS
jgi:hypothetical protein